jgi:hypothetical protein
MNLKFTATVNAVVEGLGAGEYTLDGAPSEEKVPFGDRKHPKVGCLRQSALQPCARSFSPVK